MYQNPDQRILDLESRLEESQKRGKNPQTVDLLNDLSWELRHKDTRRALTLSHLAAEISGTLSYRPGAARSIRNQGYLHLLQSNNQTALTKSYEALRVFEELQDEMGQAASLNTIGNVYHALGDYGNALKIHMKSLRLKETAEDFKGLAQTLNNIGTVYHRLNDTARAMEYYLKSLKIDQEIGDRSGEVAALNNIALLYQEIGEYEKALEFYMASLSKEDCNDAKHAVLLMNIGNVYMLLGNHSVSKNYHLQSLGIKQAIGDREGEATSLVNMGELYEAMEDFQGAMESYKAGLKITREIRDKYVEASTLINMGNLFLKKDSAVDALEHLELALGIAQSINSRELIYKSHRSLSKALESRGRWQEALQHHKLFHDQWEQAAGEETERKTRALMVQFEVETTQKEKEIYRLKNVELVDLNNDLKALTQSLQEIGEEKSRLMEELKRKAELLHQQAKVDSLTGIWNRRHIDQELDNEFQRARRFGHPLSVVMADIDLFKNINDKYSHILGDEVLRTVAQLIRKTCRTIDVVARYGGEEFLLYLPETTGERAFIACEKIRKAVEDYEWHELDPGLKVTISFGISDDMTVTNHERMISAADAKLYEAKNAGRNQTCI